MKNNDELKESSNSLITKTLDDPTWLYLSFAFKTIKQMKDINTTDFMMNYSSRQEYLMGCLSSFLAIESSINRLYCEVFLREDDWAKRSIIKTIPQNHINYIRSQWKRISIKDKYLLLPPIISEHSFDEQSNEIKFLKEFITFRNTLVHSNVKEITLEINDSEDDFIKRYKLENQKPNINNLTKFSSTFWDLHLGDVEKSLEISLSVINCLTNKVNMTPPKIVYEKTILTTKDIKEQMNTHFNLL